MHSRWCASQEEMRMNGRIIAIVLIVIGAAFLLGALFYLVDNLTTSQPIGLGSWIINIFVAVIGAGAGIEGWLNLKKKDSPTTQVNASDHAQVNVGQGGRNVQTQTYIAHAEINQPTSALRSLYQLPPAPADFTGREEQLKQVLDSLAQHKAVARCGFLLI